MNKKLIFLEMLVCLLALSLVFVSCGNDSTGESSPNDGTWSDGSQELILSGTNYRFRQVIDETLILKDISKGTFTADLSAESGPLTINQTHQLHNSGQFLSRPLSDSGTFIKSGNSMTLSGFSDFWALNGTWTK
jgi:hypothetical protein